MAFILNSPVFTGNPQAPTPLTSDNSTSIATTAYVKAQGYLTAAVTAITIAAANGITGSSSGGNTPALTIVLGAITPTSVNGLTLAALATGFTLAGGTASKTLQVNKTITLDATSDSLTLNIGGGGTLGTAAFTAASAYEPALGNPGTNGWVLSSTTGGVRSWVAMTAGFTNPMTTYGDLMYMNATPAATRLPGNTTTTMQVLTQTGNGTTSGVPTWVNGQVTIGSTVVTIGGSQTTFSGVTLNNAAVTGTFTLAADPTLALQAATKQYVDNAVLGLLDDRGSYDASVNTFPASGGSGTAGAIMKGDLWYISVAGTLGGKSVAIGSTVRALTDAPGQTATNWDILNVGLGFTPATQNQTMYLGTTALTINATTGTQTTLAGMTSITSTTFVGSLTGNASGTAASFTGNLTGDVTSTGMATTLTGATIVGKAITGYVAGTDATALTATDTLLQAFQKLQYQNTLQLLSGISTKTTTYNPTLITDKYLRLDATSGAFAVTLLAAPTHGQVMFFKKIDSSANAITINGNGKTIDGAASFTLSAQWNAIGMIYNSATSTWDII
jgi:hypothetical protein